MQSNRLMLIIAVVAGVVAMALAFSYISSATTAMESEQKEPSVSILFAINDLPANHPIDPDVDLMARDVGLSTSPGLAQAGVKADELESLRGKLTNAAIPAGMPLMYAHLAEVKDLELGPASRAMSITVSAEGVLGGILVPGDRIDIYVSYRLEQLKDVKGPELDLSDPKKLMSALFSQAIVQSASPDTWETKLVLEDIKVLAIGDRLERSRQQHMFAGPGQVVGNDEAQSSNVVTVEVTPVQALKLIQARAGGNNPLTVLLRPSRPDLMSGSEPSGG